MFRIAYRKGPRDAYLYIGKDIAAEWYTMQDAIMHADILQEVVFQVIVENSQTGAAVYDAMSGTYT